MTTHRNSLVGALAFLCCNTWLIGDMAGAVQQTMERPQYDLRLRVQVDLQKQFVGENFPITVVLSNLDPSPLNLVGFQFSPRTPDLQLSLPGLDDYVSLPAGAHETAGSCPTVSIAPGQSLEYSRWFYRDCSADRWRMPPGLYKVRGAMTLTVAGKNDTQNSSVFQLTSDPVTFVLEKPAGQTGRALAFLRGHGKRLEELLRNPPLDFDATEHTIDMYGDFLDRYSGVSYANEIRWRLAKMLCSELGNNRVATSDLATTVDVFEECVTFCLDRGGLFSQGLLSWDMAVGGNGVLDLAREHSRLDLLKRVAEELDRTYPNDEGAILYRRVLVCAESASCGEAAAVVAAMQQRFPDDKHTSSAAEFLEYSEKHGKCRERRELQSPSGEVQHVVADVSCADCVSRAFNTCPRGRVGSVSCGQNKTCSFTCRERCPEG